MAPVLPTSGLLPPPDRLRHRGPRGKGERDTDSVLDRA